MKTLIEDIPIRWMVLADKKDVLNILFLNDDYTDKKELVSLMHKYTFRCAYAGIHGRAIGVMAYRITSPHIEMIMLYAHPEYDVEAVMNSLLAKLTEKFATGAAKKLFFWVPEVDLNTQLFLKHNGFFATKVKDDEYLMERTV